MGPKRVREIVERETWAHHEGTTAITFVGEPMIGSTALKEQTILASFCARKNDEEDERRLRARLAALAPTFARLLLEAWGGNTTTAEELERWHLHVFDALRAAGVLDE